MISFAGDKDATRRTSVRYKIEKYLLRAEKIYNMHLSPEMRSFRELVSFIIRKKIFFSAHYFILDAS